MKKTLIACIVALFAFASCDKATFLNADQESITSTIKGGDVKVMLHSDGKAFEIEHTPEWATASLVDSILTLNVQKNTTRALRTDSVVVICGGMRLCLPISQSAMATHMNLEKDTVSIGKEGGEAKVKIDCDGDITVEDLPQSVTSSYENGVLTIKAAPNNGSTIKGAVTLKSDTITRVLAVEVEGNICTRCKGTGKVTCTACGGTGGTAIGFRYIMGCEQCGGCGAEGGEIHDYPFRIGTGKMKCPTCGGTGH